ncbi:MAG: ferrous iron transport protein A [Chloroflexales bacterium]|nr:ferrous iron transport protein A [Chloroflexales bacterium]
MRSGPPGCRRSAQRRPPGLKAFLERPPGACRSPRPASDTVAQRPQPLTNCAAGARGQIAALQVEPTTAAFLRAQGLVPGAEAEVLVVSADGALLLGVDGCQLALAAAVAAQVTLAMAPTGHAARREAWARCTAFWACPHGEECARAPVLSEAI